MRVEVLKDRDGGILDARNADDLKYRPWGAGDLASFTHTVEDWTEEDYREHRGTPELDAFEATLLKDAKLDELKAEIERRGLDPATVFDATGLAERL